MSAILVIDDEKGLLHVIRQALIQNGHDVETATDGNEGIRKFDDGCFDLVITDIRMPGIDGNGVVAHIRKSDKKPIPVIAISGTPWMLEQNAFDVVLPKPFPLQDLVESIQNLVPSAPQIAIGS